MILCRWKNDWYVSTGINKEKQICWLRAGPNMPHPTSFKPLPPAAVYYGSVPYDNMFVFYPTLRYRGIPVSVFHGWHPESEEPLLSLAIWGRPRLSPDEPYEVVKQRWERLISEGWEDGGRDGMAGYVHVEDPDLEKIEGPPPDGPF